MYFRGDQSEEILNSLKLSELKSYSSIIFQLKATILFYNYKKFNLLTCESQFSNSTILDDSID